MSFRKFLGAALVADCIVSNAANEVAKTVVASTVVADEMAQYRHDELLDALQEQQPSLPWGGEVIKAPEPPDPLADARAETANLIWTVPGFTPAQANML